MTTLLLLQLAALVLAGVHFLFTRLWNTFERQFDSVTHPGLPCHSDRDRQAPRPGPDRPGH